MSGNYGDLPLFYGATGVCLLLLGYFLAGGRLGRNLFNPIIGFLFFFAFIFCFLPIFDLLNATHVYELSYAQETIFYGALITFAFAAFTVAFYYLAGGNDAFLKYRKNFEEAETWDQPSNWELFTVLAFIGLPGALALLYQALQILSAGSLAQYLANRVKNSEGEGFFQMPLQWFLPAMLIYFAWYYAKPILYRKRKKPWIGIFLLLMSIASGLIIGSRTKAVIPIVLLIFAYYMIALRSRPDKKQEFRFAVVLATLGIIGFVLGPVRQQLLSGKDVQVADAVAETNTGDSLKEFENVWWLVDHMEDDQRVGGASYLTILVGAVPRGMWEDKPVGGGPDLLNLIHPGAYEVTSSKLKSSITPGMPAEAILNFGYPGILIVGAAYGFILAWAARLTRLVRNPYMAAIWFVLLFRLIEAIHTEAFGEAGNIVASVTPVLLIIFVKYCIKQLKAFINPKPALASTPQVVSE